MDRGHLERIAGEPGEARALRDSLAEHRYGFATLVGELELVDEGITPVTHPALYSFVYGDVLATGTSASGLLHALFWLSVPVAQERYESILPGSLRRLLEGRGLVVEDGPDVVGTVAITEVDGRYFLSDLMFRNSGQGRLEFSQDPNTVMPPHASSLELLAHCSPRGRSLLDIGCGSGCLSILLADSFEAIHGFDSSPRAVLFSRLNARINEVDASFEVGDLWSHTPSTASDYGIFNSPWGPASIPVDRQGRGSVQLLGDLIRTSSSRLLRPGGGLDVFCIFELDRNQPTVEQALADELSSIAGISYGCHELRDSSHHLNAEAIASRTPPPFSNLATTRDEGSELLAQLAADGVREVVPAVVSASLGPG